MSVFAELTAKEHNNIRNVNVFYIKGETRKLTFRKIPYLRRFDGAFRQSLFEYCCKRFGFFGSVGKNYDVRRIFSEKLRKYVVTVHRTVRGELSQISVDIRFRVTENGAQLYTSFHENRCFHYRRRKRRIYG